jgi:hypothetical protein
MQSEQGYTAAEQLSGSSKDTTELSLLPPSFPARGFLSFIGEFPPPSRRRSGDLVRTSTASHIAHCAKGTRRDRVSQSSDAALCLVRTGLAPPKKMHVPQSLVFFF